MTRLVEASERIEVMAARVSPRVGADLYLLDELLTDEERAFRDKARPSASARRFRSRRSIGTARSFRSR
jgi:hypothetical protein